jgi:precorrin-6B methylase 2
MNYGDESFRLTMASHGKDVMWVPTKVKAVTEMLSAAKITANDIVYDLGSGDGIIPIEAAKQFKVRAVGIEYNADLVQLSIRNAKRDGVESLVTLKQGDIFLEDFSEATVLMLYLGENLNLKLEPKILKMKPGTRVVSNTFRMGSWVPDSIIKPSTDETAYLWIVPAELDGEWEIRGLFESNISRLRIIQKKQFFRLLRACQCGLQCASNPSIAAEQQRAFRRLRVPSPSGVPSLLLGLRHQRRDTDAASEEVIH